MKAAYLYGPNDMRIMDVPIPECPPKGALVKLDGSLICGTDLKIYSNGHPKIKLPQIIGHECCGEIVEIKDNEYGLKKGDRVTMQTALYCGKCEMCQKGFFNLCNNLEAISWNFPGTFAEYVAVPEKALRLGNLMKAPSNLKNEEVCIAEPLACVINGQDLLNITAGETVLVVGGGPIGILHSELARIKGAKVVLAEKSKDRLNYAKKFEYDDYIDTDVENLYEAIMKGTDNQGVDVAIVTAPVKSVFEEAIKVMKPRGRVSFFASLPVEKSSVTIESREIHYKELTIVGSSASTAHHMKRALDILSSGKIKTEYIITDKLPLESIVDGIMLCKNGKALKVYLKNS